MHIHQLKLYFKAIGGHDTVTHLIFIAVAQIIYAWQTHNYRVKILSHDESGRLFFPTEEEILLQQWL